MRVSLKKNIDVLKVEDDFAVLERVTQTRVEVGVRCFLDVNLALHANAITLNATVYSKNPRSRPPAPATGRPRDFIANIKSSGARQQDTLVDNRTKGISSKNFDLTALISNDTNDTSRINTSILVEQETSQLREQKITYQDIDVSLRQQSTDALLLRNLDPGGPWNVKPAWYPKATKAFDNALRSVENVADTYKFTSTRQQTRMRCLDETLSLSLSDVYNLPTIYIKLTVLNSSSEVLSTVVRAFSIDSALDTYYTPAKSPSIAVSMLTPGINTIQVIQNDKVATRIELHRKKIDTNRHNVAASFELVNEINLTHASGITRINDIVNNSKSYIYRVVAVGPRGAKSATFGSAVTSRHFTADKISDNSFMSHVSVNADIVSDGIEVTVSNIQLGPIATYVIAIDKTTSNKALRNKHRVVGDVVLLRENSREHVVVDKNVKNRHIYEYHAVLVYRSGKETISTSYEMCEYMLKHETPDAAQASINTSRPQLTSDRNDEYVIGFDLSGSITESGVAGLLSMLDGLGVSQNFVDELQADRAKFAKLIVFSVERKNTTTGNTEHMGMFEIGKFSDTKELRSIAGVKNLVAGHAYRYTIKLLIRNALTLFASSTQENISLEQLAVYNTKTSKFFSPLSRQLGVIAASSAAAGKEFTSGLRQADEFYNGRTGVTMTVDIAIPKQASRVVGINVARGNYRTLADSRTKNKRPALSQPNRCKENVVSWAVNGTSADYDHFIVVASYKGNTERIATVMPHTNGSYTYSDIKYADKAGTVSYSVIPVRSDFSYEKSTENMTIFNKTRFPKPIEDSLRTVNEKRGT
jgi:hypothetical protein